MSGIARFPSLPAALSASYSLSIILVILFFLLIPLHETNSDKFLALVGEKEGVTGSAE